MTWTTKAVRKPSPQVSGRQRRDRHRVIRLSQLPPRRQRQLTATYLTVRHRVRYRRATRRAAKPPLTWRRTLRPRRVRQRTPPRTVPTSAERTPLSLTACPPFPPTASDGRHRFRSRRPRITGRPAVSRNLPLMLRRPPLPRVPRRPGLRRRTSLRPVQPHPVQPHPVQRRPSQRRPVPRRPVQRRRGPRHRPFHRPRSPGIRPMRRRTRRRLRHGAS